MNSTDRLRARYPEFLQTADPRTETVVGALDIAYSAKAPEQLRARIAQLPRHPELQAGNLGLHVADIHIVGPADRKIAAGIQLHPWRQRLGMRVLGSKPVISALTTAVTMALVVALVFAAGSSLRRIPSTPTNYGVGNPTKPTACELAAIRFPKGTPAASQSGRNAGIVVSPSDAKDDTVATVTSRVSTSQYHDAYLTCSAIPYRGTRVRLSAELKLTSVSASAGLNMVISSPMTVEHPGGTRWADTMQDRAITGSASWRTYSVVLDVPEESTGFKFGPWLEGIGTLSIRDLRFASVTTDVAVTNYTVWPRNLDFSHGELAWFPAGTAPNSFTTSIQSHTAPGGGASLAIQSQVRNVARDGAVVQAISASRFRGKRLRFSMEIKTVHMTGPVQLWALPEGPLPGGEYSDMRFRPITSTTAWRRYSIVFDVPRNSEDINVGIAFQGTGTVWMTNGSFTPVEKSVPATIG